MIKLKKPALIFILITLWLALEYFILGPYSYVRIFDVGNIHIPQNIIVAKDFWKWGTSYWYPYTLGGIDLLAEGYRPLNLNYMNFFYYLFPAWLAYPLFLLGVVWVGGYFTYRLAKDHLGLSEHSSFFAGVSLASVLGVWALCFISFVPLVLFCLNKIHEKGKITFLYNLGIIPLALLFASGSQFVFDHIAFILIPAWFFFVLKKCDRRFWLLYIFFVVLALLYYSPTLWAQFANGSYSHRANDPMSLGYHLNIVTEMLLLMHDQTPLHIIFPLIWTLGIFLALWQFRFRNVKFNGLLLLFFLLIAAAYLSNIFVFLFQDRLSFFRGIHFHYTLLSLPIFFALAGSFALERIQMTPNRLWKIFLCLFLLSLYPKTLNFNRWSLGDHYVNLYQKRELEKLASQSEKGSFRVGSATWGIFHPIAEAYGLEAVDGYVHLYPRRYEFFMSTLLNNEEHSVGSRVQLYSKNLNWVLLSLANVKYILSDGSTDLFSNRYLMENQLGEYFVPSSDIHVKHPNLSAWNKIKKIFVRIPQNFRAQDNLYIFENKNVLPRFFISKTPQFFEATEDLLKAMRSVSDSSFFKEYVFIEKEFQSSIPFRKGDFRLADIKIFEYSPDRIQLSVAVDGTGMLIASNSYSPFWRVTIDGKVGKIIPAYYAFWGVPLQKGNHEIIFTYDPPYKFF